MKPIKINSQEKEIEVKYKYRVKNTVTPKNVTVKFESNGGSNVEPQTIKYGELLTEPDKPTREGDTFVDWDLDEQYKYVYNFQDYVPQQDGTLYAKWINLNDDTNTDGDGSSDGTEIEIDTDLLSANESSMYRLQQKEMMELPVYLLWSICLVIRLSP